jgi:hypothetical protein
MMENRFPRVWVPGSENRDRLQLGAQPLLSWSEPGIEVAKSIPNLGFVAVRKVAQVRYKQFRVPAFE